MIINIYPYIKNFNFYYRRLKYNIIGYPKVSKKLGYTVNIDNPKSFNEKINYRMKHGNFKEFSNYADKYKVRDYVKKVIGKEYLIPLYGFYKKLTLSDLQQLPNKFIIKANHGSGKKFIAIITDKKNTNLKKVIKKMNTAVKINFGSREKHYDYIERGLIIEKYIGNNQKLPNDYKFHCFANGHILIQYDTNRFTAHSRCLYDINFNEIKGVKLNKYPINNQQKKPENLDVMLLIARKLAKPFDYTRVDLYSVNNQIYFGEITLTPSAGSEYFTPYSYDFSLGKHWILEKTNNKIYQQRM